MRHLARTLRSCGIMLVLCASAGAGPATPRRDVAPENPQEYLLRRALADKTVSWLQTNDADAGSQCDKSAESLLAVDKPSALSYFTAAQSAWLRGQPQLAIARLRKAVEERGDQSAPTNVIMPVKVVGPLWIATIARYSGSMALARDEYKKLLATLSENVKENGGEMLFVYLHLAEIGTDHCQNRKEAHAYLQAADLLIASNRGEKPSGIMGQWIQYERTKLAHGKPQANRELLGESDMMSLPIFHTNLMGLTGNPLREWCSSSACPPDIPNSVLWPGTWRKRRNRCAAAGVERNRKGSTPQQ